MEHNYSDPAPLAHISEQDLELNRNLPREVIFLPQNTSVEASTLTVEYRDSTFVNGHRVDITMEMPDDPVSYVPVIIPHGYCASEKAYVRYRNALSQAGYIAVSYNPPEQVKKSFISLLTKNAVQSLIKPELLLTDTVTAVAHKVTEMGKHYHTDAEELYDLSPHSMGATSSTRAALNDPDLYRTISYHTPAGFEPQGLPVMIGRLKKFSKEVPGTNLDILIGGLEYITRAPFRTAAEGIAVARNDIRELTMQLGGVGIRTAILVARADELTTARGIARASGTGVVDLFVVYKNPRADHLYLQKHPAEAAKAQVQVVEKLVAMNNTSKKRKLAA